MDRVIITRPFVEGVNLDVPDYLLRPRQASAMTDAITPRGILMQRKGWTYDGTTAAVASNLQSFWRAPYVMADVTRSLVSAANNNVYIHNPAGAGTQVGAGSTTILARAVYRDETLWCHQDGIKPLMRYSGAAFNTDSGASAVTFTAGQSIVTATTGTFGANVTPGAFWSVTSVTPSPANDSIQPNIWFRVIERISSTVLSLEDFWAEAGGGTMAFVDSARGMGYGYPCVDVYSAGTVSTGVNVAGVGVQWVSGSWGLVNIVDDALLFPVAGTDADLMQGKLNSVVDNDTMTLLFEDNTISNQPYSITRRMPFKDVAAHRDCLWGSGVAQYPNRLYVGPPGWNIGVPPGVSPPFDASVNFHSTSRRDFLMDTIDIPSPYDGDYIVAILNTDQGLLVCKRGGAWMVDGVYPTFTTRLLSHEAGCIDIKGAQNLPSGPVWVGEYGAYLWRNGRIINMMEGTIKDYWAHNFGTKITTATAYCSVGENDGHIRLSAKNDSGTTATFIFDASSGVWLGTHTNQVCRNYFSAEVPGEAEELYGVSDSFQGRPIKLAGCTDAELLVERDGDGTKPALSVTTGSNMTPEVIDEERKMVDFAVTANVYDGGAAGSTILRVSHTSGGALRANADETTVLTNINSDTVNRVDRHYIRRVDKSGRYHKITFSVPTFDTDAHASGAKVEISEISMTFAPTAERS